MNLLKTKAGKITFIVGTVIIVILVGYALTHGHIENLGHTYLSNS